MNHSRIWFDLPVTQENLGERMRQDHTVLSANVRPAQELTHDEVMAMIEERHE